MSINKIPFPPKRKLAEVMCVLFGHDFSSYEEISSHECNYPLERSNECGRCGLVNRDQSGYIRLYESRSPAPSAAAKEQ